MRSKRKEKFKEKIFRELISTIKRAYQAAYTAMIYQISFYCAPRGSNWTMLKYYDDEKLSNSILPTFTYHQEKDQYRIFVPIKGPSLISDSNETVRYLKNADTENASAIALLLDKKLNKYIRPFLAARDKYIELVLPSEIESVINKSKESIQCLSEGMVKNLTPKDEKILIGELKKDIESLENTDLNSTLPLFVWITHRKPYQSLKADVLEGYISQEAWFETNTYYRELMMSRHTLSGSFKDNTEYAFYALDNNTKITGINLHGMRHLSATVHLRKNPKNYAKVAAILNDSVAQVMLTYGPKNRRHTMKEIERNGL